MHTIKSKAKQIAWPRDQGAQYSPFSRPGRVQTGANGRSQSRTNSSDPEKALSARNITNGSTRSPDPFDNKDPSSNPSSSDVNGNSLNFRTNSNQVNGKGPQNGQDEEEKPKKQKFKFWPQVKEVLFGSYINVLLICVPVGIAINYVEKVSRVAVFVINFLAIMPLAGILSYSTEEISMRVGETLGGLLNASFGNAVELIVSIIALAQNEIIIVQTSLIGSMLSNLLLVLGMCFFLGGIGRPHQNFNITVAQTASSLLALAVASLIVPTVFADWGNAGTPEQRYAKIPALSRGVSVILLLVYGCYLFFQLKTHADIYNEKSEKVPIKRTPEGERNRFQRGWHKMRHMKDNASSSGRDGGDSPQIEKSDNRFGDEQQDENERQGENGANDDVEEEQPRLSVIGAIVTLCISTALVGVCAEYMVSAISAVTKQGGISPEFVGLILIPIVGNAAEHATAVTVAIKDKMDLAIGVAVGSSMQIALLVLPLVVVIGWIMGRSDMTLDFDGFLIALLFIAVLLVNYLIADGRSHWLEGVLLMATYIIIAVAAYFYPESADVVG